MLAARFAVPCRSSRFVFLYPVSPYVSLGVSIRACCLASRLVAFLSCVPLLRLVIAFRFPHSLRSSPFVFARLRSSSVGGVFLAAPFRFAVRSFLFVPRPVARHASLFSPRFLSHMYVPRGVSLVVSSSRLVMPSRLVIRLPVGVSCPFSGPVPVFAPFRPARRSFLFAYSVLGSLVLVSVMRQGGASWP